MTERILAAADRLFYQQGIRAVGVDTIAAAAGISKRSLYDTFASKDALVEAYLETRTRPQAESDDPPMKQILALFDQLHQRFESGEFRGCPFVNAVTELAQDCEAARTIARRFKDARRQHVQALLERLGAEDAAGLSVQISLLYEGAIAMMLVHGDPVVAWQARDAAAVLLSAGPAAG